MVYNKKTTTVKKKTTHICSECIGDFDAKNLFIAQVPNRDYTTVYCEKCLDILGITEFKPYHKVSIKKTDTEKKTFVKSKVIKNVVKNVKNQKLKKI